MATVQIKKHNDFEILTLSRGRANPLNTQVCEDISKELNRIDSDPSVRGLIITGNTPGFFSVGLDLIELNSLDENGIQKFWESWENMVMALIKFKKPIISAINGYSPAGGCVIAVTCDYRVMAEDEKFVIGLNETGVGIVVPEYIFFLYEFWIGKSAAYQHLMDATLHSPSQALKAGLINETCPMDEVLTKAIQKMESWLKKPDNVIQKSKMNMRAGLIRNIESTEKVSQEEKLKAWFDPKSKAVRDVLVASLAK